MASLSVEILSRIQFAFTITFHYIYPPISIGLSLILILFEGLYLKTKKRIWQRLSKFWTGVFALSFALGVATGIPLQFSLGTNWSRYSRFVGDVFGSALSAEGLFAFLIEGGFLGLLIFGWNKMSPKMHFFSTCMVAFGAHFSAFWITSANAWMQYPSGFELMNGNNGFTVARVTDWLKMVFNPMALSSIAHVILSAWLTGAFLVVSISAYYLLKKRETNFAKYGFKISITFAFIITIMQLFSGDTLAKDVARYNPVKMAAFEGLFETTTQAPIYAIGWVNVKEKKTKGIPLPGLLSFLIHGNTNEKVQGLNDFPQNEWPLVSPVFQLYHLMITCWGLMFISSLLGLWIWIRKKWGNSKWIFRFLIISVSFPQIANIAGWYSTCMGRQPWTVYRLLKTKEAFSPNITAGENLFTLICFIALYLTFFALFLFLLDRKIKKGPDADDHDTIYRGGFD